MKFHTRFSPGLRPKVECTIEERRTKQEFKDECDINLLMARYKKTGVLPTHSLAAAVRYGDFSQIPSFHEMHDRVLAATDVFMALPAHVRKHYGNDPGLFLASSETPEGRELMVRLGLATKREAKAPNAPAEAAKPAVTPPKEEKPSKKVE